MSSAPRANTAPHHLASVPIKLARLFGLGPGDAVALPALAPAQWYDEFRELGMAVNTAPAQGYALLIETDPTASALLMRSGQLESALSENGVALLQVTRTESCWNQLLRRIGRRLRRNQGGPAPQTLRLEGKFSRLAGAGAAIQRNLTALEQIDLLPTVSERHGLKVHRPADLATEPLIVALSRTGHPFGHPLAQLRELLPEADPDYQLQRIMLRSRGALMLSLRGKTGESHIARLCGSADIAAIVGRNCAALHQLHANPHLPSFCRDRIPRVVAHSSDTFIEQQLPGEPSWQWVEMERPPAGEILRDAWEFSLGLGIATAERTEITTEVYQRLVGDDIGFLREFCTGDSQLLAALATAEMQLSEALIGRPASIVTAHGDYGYGNLLCDPSTGRLTGVFDWDTCRYTELPCIDFLNLLIQHLRMQVGLANAPQAVLAWLHNGSNEAVEIKLALHKLFDVDEQRLPLYIRIAVLHLMGRDFRYRVPGSLNQEERGLVMTLTQPLV